MSKSPTSRTLDFCRKRGWIPYVTEHFNMFAHKRYDLYGGIDLVVMDDQPGLLDMIHGAVRDCDAWIKVAAIEHLTRWYDPASQIGLQTGHDAADIDLDVTLQDLSRASSF